MFFNYKNIFREIKTKCRILMKLVKFTIYRLSMIMMFSIIIAKFVTVICKNMGKANYRRK